MRASSWSAPGKHSFIRVEEQVQRDASGRIQILHIKEMVGDQIIVKLPEGSTQQTAEAMASKIGARAGSRSFAPDTWLFKLERKLEAVPEGMESLKSSGAIIDYTEPDLIVRPARTPNDPKFTDLTSWQFYNNTQINKDIKAAAAWDRRTTAAYGTTNKVIVAVIDTGVRYTHEDLAANMWKNPGETGGGKETNGIDDDGNGWIDDIYGIDAYGTEDWIDRDFDAKKDGPPFENSYTDSNGNGRWDADVDPMDEGGHGSHCAGEIGAVGNNGVGAVGVAWGGVEIMALRFIGPSGGSISDEVLCMDYARSKGAKVINASFGQGGGQSQTEIDAITRLNGNGVIVVAACGNGTDEKYTDQNNNGSYDFGEPFEDWNNNGIRDTGQWHDNDAHGFYPASYTNSNIIAVGATDQNDNKSSYSNYGATTVDLFAPGDNIYACGTGADNSYYSGSGTSFAAPIVSGALALQIAEFTNETTVAQRVARMVSTNAVDVLPSLSGYCVTGGRLNLAKLLPAADPSTLPLAVAWHRPDYTEPLLGSAMRTPTNAAISNTLTVFSGVKKFNNTNGLNTSGLVNQTGGWLFYRTSSSVAWTSNALAYHSNTNDYQFWKGTISNAAAQTYQYYVQLDFDSGARTTYSYYTNNADGFATTTNPTIAQLSPYTFTVAKASATVTFSNLTQTYNGSARPVAASTTPSGLSTSITYDGSSSAPTNVGSYTVVATVNDANYVGSATNTLTVVKATATVTFSNLTQTYNGSARSVTASTTPSGLATSITYNGSSSTPTNAGSYTVVATVNDANYQGSATNTLTVAKASATVILGSLNQTYDGVAKPASATTSPGGLTVNFTYDGSSSAPTNAGSYAVVGTISDPNYTGSSSGTLVVNKASATLSITDLNQTYDGSPKSVGVTTTPSGLAVSTTYNGSANAPTAAGSYAVAVSITDPNYQGSASATLTIQPPPVSFASSFGSTTPTSDADGDGIPALVEYALGGSTNGNDQSLLPVLSVSGSNISMAAVVRTNDTNLLIYPQACLNLSSSNWISSGFTTNTSNQTNVPTGFQRREYLFNAGTNTRAFLKLTIQQQ